MRRGLALALGLGAFAASEPAPDPGAQGGRVHVDGAPVCTGVFVSRRQVLTARHCLPESRDAARVSVMQAGRAQALRAWRIDAASAGGLEGDVALIQLEGEVDVTPVRLPAGPRTLRPGTPVRLWRMTLDGPVPLERAAATGRVTAVDPGILYTSPMSCDGDSGGPLLSPAGELVAVASSRAQGECGEGPSVFTALGPHLPWLQSLLAEAPRQ